MTTGFIERFKGKTLESAASLQQFGKGGAVNAGGGQISVQTSYAGIGNGSDTSEDILFTYALPGGSFDITGRNLLITAFGTFAANTIIKQAKLYFGGETVVTGTFNANALTPWWLQLNVFKAGTAQQLISAQAIIGSTHSGTTYQTAAESDTQSITIKCTGQTTTTAQQNCILGAAMQVEALN